MGPNKFILDSSDMGIGLELEGCLKATISSMELFQQAKRQKKGQSSIQKKITKEKEEKKEKKEKGVFKSTT